MPYIEADEIIHPCMQFLKHILSKLSSRFQYNQQRLAYLLYHLMHEF